MASGYRWIIQMQTLRDIAAKLKKTEQYWISFTGDSLTSCEWVHPNWRDIVIYVLQSELTEYLKGDWELAEWGIKGFNFAYDGATTTDIVENMDEIFSVEPDLIIGLMGGNDPTLGVSVKQSVENIGSVFGEASKNGADVIWCSSTPAARGSDKNREYEPYANTLLRLKCGKGQQIIDMFHLYSAFPLEKFFTFRSEEIKSEGIKEGDPDLVHPNQLGNAYIAKVVLSKGFGIEFDPERYISDTLGGEKYPGY